jgi:predicted phage replisome organizer
MHFLFTKEKIMADQKKFYWLKLKKDFFKRHDIQIIESMPNGKDYVLFYLKLMCESIDHEGNLRFSDTIPYNEQMLSTITNTNIDVVRSALKLLQELNMIEILDDHTIYMNEVDKLIGSAVDNDNANRQRRFRERQKEQLLAERYESVTENNESKRIDIEKDKDKELDKEKDTKSKKRKVFVPPTYEEVFEYAKEKGREDIAKEFFDYFTVGDWFDSKGNKVKNWKQKFITWCSRNKVKKGATNEVNSGDNDGTNRQKYGTYV